MPALDGLLRPQKSVKIEEYEIPVARFSEEASRSGHATPRREWAAIRKGLFMSLALLCPDCLRTDAFEQSGPPVK